jgi:hypothetical protein
LPPLIDEDDVTSNDADALLPGDRLSAEELNEPDSPLGSAEVRLNVEAVQAELSVLVTVTV